MRVAGQAIQRRLRANGDPAESAIADPGESGAIGLGFDKRILDLSAPFLVVFTLFLFPRAQPGRLHKSRHVIIAEVARRGGKGQHERAGRIFHAPRKLGAFVDAVISAEEVARDRLFRNRFRDQAVNHIDHAADGLAPISQRSRSAQDLDLLGIDAVGDHLVIRARGGHVDHADTVGQNLNPFSPQSAQYRPARALSEESRGNAGLSGQRVPQC